jgi:lipopolysaccharide/colanic/teichoic acid biosynthesis glycosyltransferase
MLTFLLTRMHIRPVEMLVSQPISIKKDKLGSLVSQKLLEYISLYADLDSSCTKIMKTGTLFNIESLDAGEINTFINLKRINDIRYLNKYFETVNKKIRHDGIFIGCVETLVQRKKRIFSKYNRLIARPFYTVDFIYKRVFPKWSLTRKIYFMLTNGNNRVLSRAEVLGRLISCGFKILDLKNFDGKMYFVCRAVEGPAYDKHVSYGLILKTDRIGNQGKIIKVYKLRTMHPFAEYLQEYVYNNNKLSEGGKFKDDFRITSWGRIMRKLWIDELPMIINWFRGELKLVGIRPLSPHYLSLYDKGFQKKRISYKPGLVPPFYADMPKTLDEIIESEERYLNLYDKHPVKTDIQYFFRSFYNIILRGARSR